MKNIDSFLSARKVYEYRTAGSKNMPKDMDAIKGKDAEKNGTQGAVGYAEPTDDSAVTKIPKEQYDRNMRRLMMKFRTKEDFFVIGRAGWGKTSVINQLCEKYHLEKPITLYLDKIDAVELGGTPVPVEKNGKARRELLMPEWAAPLVDNPDKKFLLFFDEMNQAQPDVMNALMPIVLEHEIAKVKFDNFFVGAAGNFESENGAVNELSGPLASRFKPIITWETDTDETWDSAFRYLHKEYDSKTGKELIDKVEEVRTLFENPREIERNIIKWAYKMRFPETKEDEEDKEIFETSDYLERLENLSRENLNRSQKDQLAELADYLYEYVNRKGSVEDDDKKKKTGRSSEKKDISMIPPKVLKAIEHGMKFGYIIQEEDGKDVKYGISRENIFSIEEMDKSVNAEMLERIINKNEADGIKFKFEKDEEWKKLGYKDPNED